MERMDCFISFTLEVDDKVGRVKIGQLGRMLTRRKESIGKSNP